MITYGGPIKPLQGYTGEVVRRDANGAWITFSDYYLNGDPVDPNFAFGVTETILHHFFGHPYIAPRVSLYLTHDELAEHTINA